MTRGLRAALVVLGALTMGYAVAGALADPDVPALATLRFLAGVLVAHDAVLLPATIGAGALIGRFVPAGIRATVRVAGFVTLVLAVVTMPLVLGFGRRPDDPSALPLDYGRGLAVAVLAIWTASFAVLLTRRVVRKRPGRGGTRAG